MNTKFPASLDKLHDMLGFIRSQALAAGFLDNTASKIELALEEALVNIINYAYPDKDGTVEITCQVISSPKKGIEVILLDQGVAFDPLKNAREPVFDMSVEEKPIGGYGVYLMRKIMDHVTYERLGNSNVLKLVKYID